MTSVRGSSISRHHISRTLRALSPVLGMIFVLALFKLLAPDAGISLLDLRTIAVQTVIVALAACGVALVIVAGGLDLSIGSSVALSGVVAALIARDASPTAAPWLAILAAITTGALCGLYNGALITLFRIPPFIATLGTLGFFRGVAKWISGSSPVRGESGWLSDWVRPVPPESWSWLPVAPIVFIMLALAAMSAFFLSRTVPGRQLTAIGDNTEAARRAGIPITRLTILSYILCGAFLGAAAAVQFARLGGSGDPSIAIGLELKAIAAVVIGGASLSGGVVSIWGAVAGAALMALLDNRCTAAGWPNFVQDIVVGHIIIIAVAVDRWRTRSAR
jgi:ribose transport system permease protein